VGRSGLSRHARTLTRSSHAECDGDISKLNSGFRRGEWRSTATILMVRNQSQTVCGAERGVSIDSRIHFPMDREMVSFGCNPAVVRPQSQCGGDELAIQIKLKLKARVNHSDAETIRQALDQLAAKGSVRKEGDEFLVEAETEGATAKELNRTLLSALRKVEKRTTLRAEWISDGGTTERFFDYVLKKTVKN
jgi:hypothetical protein